MSVTIKDIAKLANVSHTTVSRALNNSPYINEETKIRIKALAKELNYVPNYNAKSLVLLKSYVIGVFFSSISEGTSDTFFHEIIKGISKVIDKEYNLVIRGIDTYESSHPIDNKNFDGIIVVSQSKNDDEFINTIIEKNIPTVVINRSIENDNIINIMSNDTKGSYDAVNYFIKNNHKKIALIEGNKEFESSLYRKKGYIQALEDNNISINDNYIVSGRYNLESGYANMLKLLKLEDRPTAVFCSNDDIAVGAMKAVAEQNLNVPKDISIIGFDDSNFCSYVTPTLTSVKKDSLTMSEYGGISLLNLIKNKEVDKEKVYIESRLIVRESVAHLKE
ncbi:LacI family DNA-binding transcriptional regulator [Clostridium saccharobutylicum]|uniref:HTH-type transcriptional repressor ExuR n=1 Tax=Clostridium saccharobutylicum DSM 13864 TaxID=1345695 RepID=U5MTG8_CLOSA|nr:LacI family DNA-binding transcriptional regulator [Clostridium saccharobutylicum]AGX42931.1 HTH-type transcriptional repressor ExuR [Clostridium saccharobutylicum DSM 13864]AQR90224.1 putative HTH-type transcriptional repressor ExuR [Clostridium saccharobutylicum]AQS00130.1 putative HTH-type transcriptional repressor ExuR [Clostridium saccharobutylicum]AQS09927.1 putative HTH-type transcriptional repressor ExuR [Clostridium saccharobutylicum]AQS14113.1 putative HTH-type transcriptional repr